MDVECSRGNEAKRRRVYENDHYEAILLTVLARAGNGGYDAPVARRLMPTSAYMRGAAPAKRGGGVSRAQVRCAARRYVYGARCLSAGIVAVQRARWCYAAGEAAEALRWRGGVCCARNARAVAAL